MEKTKKILGTVGIVALGLIGTAIGYKVKKDKDSAEMVELAENIAESFDDEN